MMSFEAHALATWDDEGGTVRTRVAPPTTPLELDVSSNESVELLDGGEAAYPRMLAAIADAKRTLDLEVYAFSPFGVGAAFIEAIGSAAARGVVCRVVIDGWGSARGGRTVAAALRARGCHVVVYHRLLALMIGRFGRNHRKILLVDDEVAFLGGINIGDQYMSRGVRVGWADLALVIHGPQCARLGSMIRREPPRVAPGSVQIELCGLAGGWRLRRRYIDAFVEARRRIHIAHGYFLPDLGILRAITAAARRGVEVKLLLAGGKNMPFSNAAARSLHRRLLSAGVTIHEWNDSVLHAKVATVDGQRLLVGSFNLDPFSLANLEALVTVDDRHVVAQVEGWIRAHLALAQPMTTVEASSWRRRWLIDPFGRVVAKVAVIMSRIMGRRHRSG